MLYEDCFQTSEILTERLEYREFRIPVPLLREDIVEDISRIRWVWVLSTPTFSYSTFDESRFAKAEVVNFVGDVPRVSLLKFHWGVVLMLD